MDTKRDRMDYVLINTTTYNFKTWHECFPDGKVNLKSLSANFHWDDFFDIVMNKKYYENIEKILNKYLLGTKQIVPHPELIFNSFNVLSPKKIKVVILGQDPYINTMKFDGIDIPQAMGFCFSVPFGYPCPPSLDNVYNNLVEFKHVRERPTGGCLVGWVLQGCLLINSALTTFIHSSNAHQNLWTDFTIDLMRYLNEKCTNVVFLAWGASAHRLCAYIDHTKHFVSYSSHPSPYSYANTVNGTREGKTVTHPPFKTTDHFGRANNYLVSVGKKPILWDVIDV